jgi:hypothetical protein
MFAMVQPVFSPADAVKIRISDLVEDAALPFDGT